MRCSCKLQATLRCTDATEKSTSLWGLSLDVRSNFFSIQKHLMRRFLMTRKSQIPLTSSPRDAVKPGRLLAWSFQSSQSAAAPPKSETL